MKKLVIAALLLTSSPVLARETAIDDGNDLLTACSTSEGYCLGYIRGLSNGVDMILAQKGKRICYGQNVTLGQVRDVVVDYVRRHPATRNQNSMVLTAYALGAAWPCAAE